MQKLYSGYVIPAALIVWLHFIYKLHIIILYEVQWQCLFITYFVYYFRCDVPSIDNLTIYPDLYEVGIFNLTTPENACLRLMRRFDFYACLN